MSSRRSVCIRFVAALLLAFSPCVHAQAPVVISGRVVADETGKPVSDARVQLEGTDFARVTDANGAFSFADVPLASYTLVVTGEGFEPVRAPLDVSQGLGRPLEVRLPRPLTLREEIAVVGRTVGELGLAGESRTASRLGLNAIDVPASIDVLDSAVMDARGYQKVSDAVSSMAGVVAGEHPTAPSSFVIRGFTANQVSTLRDGIWLGPSTMIMRPQNTFNLDRVELLRGPSSVINGQGAVAGTINAITKSAQPASATSWQGLLSYGRFNSYHAAAGVAGPVSESLFYRVDVSRSGSDGYVQRTDSGSSNLTASLLWRPALRARVKFSADYLDDDLPKYFGTPLIPASAAVEPMDVIRTTTGETIDERTRFVSYNVSDAYAQSRQVLLRSDVSLDLNDRVSINNVLYGFDADRRWRNSEGYVYCTSIVDVCTTIGEIQRYYGYFLINHDQQLVGDRLTMNVNTSMRGRENRALVGFEASTLDFERTRGFRIRAPLAPGDSVDLLNPVPGVYGPEEIRGISPTGINAWALFVEDSLAVTSRVRLAGALRYDGHGPRSSQSRCQPQPGGRRIRAPVQLVELARWHRYQHHARGRRVRAVQQREGSGEREHLSGQRQPELRPHASHAVGSRSQGGRAQRAHTADDGVLRHRARRRAGAICAGQRDEHRRHFVEGRGAGRDLPV